jgi:heme A synthase
MIGIPVFALLLLITSFWVRPPGVVKAAAIVVALVATQITLGILGHSVPLLGLMHGLNALLLFASALYAARRAARPAATIPAAAGDRTVTPV